MAELVMKYQQYDEYKKVTLGWLDSLPSHWQVKKLKYLGDSIIGLTYSPDDVVQFEDKGTLVLRSSNVQNKKLAFDDNVYVKKEIPENLRTQLGDILICARNGSRALIGKNAEIDKSAVGLTFGAFMMIFRSEHNRYLSYVFNSAIFEYQSGTFLTATINQLTSSNLNSFEVPLPPKAEQAKIANFLDHETAQIDTLIDKQQTLIQLLKEKRQAVISHAVTKGLNTDAPMQDSGVEWLGEVPEHWVVSPLKLYIDTRKGVAFKSVDFTDLGVRVVKASDIKEKTIRQSDVFLPVYFSEIYPKAILSEGDIVISTVGSTPDVKNSAVGQIGMVPAELDGSLLNQNTVVFTPRNNILENLFLFYLIQTDVYRDHLDLNAHGTANQASLNVSDMLDFIFARPPREEQLKISEYIGSANKSFEELERQCVTTISLLQERRTALISAAVTGKIDVRGWRVSDFSK